MNLKNLLGVIAIIGSFGLSAGIVDAQPGNGNGVGKGRGSVRSVELLATPDAPSEDARARLTVYYNQSNREMDLLQLVIDATNLQCRGGTSSVIERETAPYEVYLLKVNGEPIVTFNTRCVYSRQSTGEFRTDTLIWGNDSWIDWLPSPRTDPLHAEVYLESPKSVPPMSTLVLEGWLY